MKHGVRVPKEVLRRSCYCIFFVRVAPRGEDPSRTTCLLPLMAVDMHTSTNTAVDMLNIMVLLLGDLFNATWAL